MRAKATLRYGLLAGAAFAAAAAALPSAPAGAQQAQQTAAPPIPGRFALVIGESSYVDGKLATSANDAGLVAQALQAAGFDVTGAADLDQQGLTQSVRDFAAKASAAGPGAITFVYLAGRAVQFGGENYFLPVDARIARPTDIPFDALRVSDLMHALDAAPAAAHVTVLDAARAAPFASPSFGLAGGLALVDPDPGALLAYDATPGTLAPVEQGPDGLYATALAEALGRRGVPLDQAFEEVKLRVNQRSNGAYLPWSASKIAHAPALFAAPPGAPATPAPLAALERRPYASVGDRDAYFLALTRDNLSTYDAFLSAYPHSAYAGRIRALRAARREALTWRRTVNIGSRQAYWTYLRLYPRGPHVEDARRFLIETSAPLAPPPDFVAVDYGFAPPPPDEDAYYRGPVFVIGEPDYAPPPPPPVFFVPAADPDWYVLPPPPPPPAAIYLPIPIFIPLFLHGHDHRPPPPGPILPGAPRAPLPQGPQPVRLMVPPPHLPPSVAARTQVPVVPPKAP
ncbi:MAG: caspase family protein, partial [Hyphomicrobiales bacterium]|nr:caspase family protein [Hyphomicrobiales bacterium]